MGKQLTFARHEPTFKEDFKLFIINFISFCKRSSSYNTFPSRKIKEKFLTQYYYFSYNVFLFLSSPCVFTNLQAVSNFTIYVHKNQSSVLNSCSFILLKYFVLYFHKYIHTIKCRNGIYTGFPQSLTKYMFM